MFSTKEVLDLAKEAEKATADKTSRKRRREGPAILEIKDQEVEGLENVSSDSISDCIVVLQHE